MNRSLASSYETGMSAFAKAKRWTIAAGDKIMNVRPSLEPWLLTILRSFSDLLISTPVLLVLFDVTLVFGPGLVLSMLMDVFVWIAGSPSEGPLTGLKTFINTALPIHICLLIPFIFYIDATVLDCATRTLLKRLKVNLNLCALSKGPSRGIRCGVCWGDMTAEDETILHKHCKNSWHTACIKGIAEYEQGAKCWAPCPMCRQPMNADSKVTRVLRTLSCIARVFRTLCSSISLDTQRLQRLSRRICYASTFFAGLVIGIYLSRHKLFGPSVEEPSRLLVIPPALITLATIFSGAALALEQFYTLERCCSLGTWSNTNSWVLHVGLLALITAGRRIQVPADFSFGHLLTVGLQRAYPRTPDLATVHWFDWMGLSHHLGVSYASAVLAGALLLTHGVFVLY